jgi:hypothetical protein
VDFKRDWSDGWVQDEQEIKVRFAVVGDVAFYKTVLGQPGTERLTLYRDCLVLWDGLSSLMRTREKLYTEEVAEEAERFLTAGLDAWFRLGLTNKVSIHTMGAHAIEDLKFWRGLWKRNEEFMEQLHQVGITDALRTRGLNTIARKAAAIQKFYWLSSRSDVRGQIRDVND